jgi:hypothetical protein
LSWILPYSIWGTRHLIVVFAPFALLFAMLLQKISRRQVRTAFITFIFLLTAYAFVLQVGRERQPYIWCAWAELAPELAAVRHAPEKLYVFEDLVAYHFWFATRNTEPKPQIVKVTGIDGIGEDNAYFLPREFNDVARSGVENINDERLWIAFRSAKWDIFAPPLNAFSIRGYSVMDRKMYSANAETAYLVLLEKGK